MFKQIVIGVDGHEGGRDAIALARQLRSDTSELTLAYIHPGDMHLRPGVDVASEAARNRPPTQVVETAQLASDVQAELCLRVSDSVGRGLHDLCEQIAADLLVVGCSRRGPLGRVLIGDDTRGAINDAPCAVAVAPVGYADHPVAMREIGVAYNGSSESEHAIEMARTIAAEHAATVSAFEGLGLPSFGYVPEPETVQGTLEELLDLARERISGHADVEPHAAFGRPVEELALYSASLDLLIVGSRGHGKLGRLVYGSMSQRLARQARCPLLVLGPGAGSDAGQRGGPPVADTATA